MTPEPGAPTGTPSPAGAGAIKACCAASYSSDLVTLLLGDSYHPGGLALTRRLLDQLDLTAGSRFLDVAAGLGTTALLAAAEYDVSVDGVELAPANVALAEAAAAARGLAARVTFHHGDAEALPLPGARYAAVVCECALCTFPDKRTAVREMARVLGPGGRLGITDVTARHDRLPPELTTLGAWVACVADARTPEDYQQLVTAAGLRVTVVEQHDHALDRMISQIEARLELLRMTARDRLDAAGLDPGQTRSVIAAVRQAIHDGTLGYMLIVAQKPAQPPAQKPAVKP